jgi:small-conductance mechanosensitive channel
METLDRYWGVISAFLTQSWFTIGETEVTPERIVALVVLLLLSWWGALAVERGIQHISRSRAGKSMSEPGVYALGRIVRYLIWILGSIIGLNFIGFDLGSLALMGGAIGVGIGFGMQNIFSNLISGLVILLEKTLKIGDFVDLQSGVMGRVSEINMRYTRITTNDAVDVIVPNSEFINGRVVNWTYGEQYRRMHIPFGVAYGSDKDRVREAGLAAARSVEFTVEGALAAPKCGWCRWAKAASTSSWLSGSGSLACARPGASPPPTCGRWRPNCARPASRFPSRSVICTCAPGVSRCSCWSPWCPLRQVL